MCRHVHETSRSPARFPVIVKLIDVVYRVRAPFVPLRFCVVARAGGRDRASTRHTHDASTHDGFDVWAVSVLRARLGVRAGRPGRPRSREGSAAPCPSRNSVPTLYVRYSVFDSTFFTFHDLVAGFGSRLRFRPHCPHCVGSVIHCRGSLDDALDSFAQWTHEARGTTPWTPAPQRTSDHPPPDRGPCRLSGLAHARLTRNIYTNKLSPSGPSVCFTAARPPTERALNLNNSSVFHPNDRSISLISSSDAILIRSTIQRRYQRLAVQPARRERRLSRWPLCPPQLPELPPASLSGG